MAEEAKRVTVARLLEAKKQSEKSFTDIARATGLTNGYVAQLFHRQAQLTPSIAPSLSQAVPSLTEFDIEAMMLPPRRSFDANLIQDPCIYRFHEAIMHYGESLRAIINEEFGDGIMSGIDFYCNLEKVKGKHGEDRVAVVFNGKFLPYLEQKSEDTVTTLP